MEVLQCDGCDFRAESYDDLKSHIQEVHTAFLQPAEVGEDGSTAEKKEEEELEEGEEEEEEGEEDVEEDDNNDKDYKPPKSEKVPHSAESDLQQAPRSNETPVKPTAESLLPFFQCKFCVRYFRSKGFLRNHNRKVHNIIDDDDDDSRKVPGSPTSENQHYRVIEHDDDGSKVFSCRYCTYKSQRHSRISKHYLSCHSKAPSKSTEGLAELAETEGADPQAKALSDFPAIKCKGTFTCEWCAFQTNQKASWTDHMLQKHSDQVKGVASVPPLEEERSAGSSKSPSSQNSPASSSIAPNDMCDNDVSPSTSPLPRETPEETRPTMEFSSFQYSQLHSVMPNSTGTSILSQRFASSNVSDSIEMLNEDDSLSCSDEDEDEDDVDETDPLFAGDSVKQLLSEEDSKMLETKGIPFRRYLNRFQCPFCSFLTMHRRSISRHIENIHLSGKTTVYKCDECPFICTSPLKLGTHKQSHSSSDVETMDLTNESPDLQNDDSSSAEPVNGGSSVGSKVNGKKIAAALNELNQQNHPHRCTLCSFSTTTLKGLRVHQQHKHSYCDDLYNATSQSPVTEQQMDSGDSSAVFVQKTQTSILGLASKKPTAGKTARKSINDLPLDLSPVKKRTRIDEIANNLQSKISQQQEDMVINLEDMEDEGESGENYLEGKDNYNAEAKNPIYTNTAHTLYGRNSTSSRDGGRVGKRKSNPRSKPRNVALTVFDDEENNHAELKDIQDQAHTDTRDTFQENLEYTEDAGVARFYCKHCDYHNKSARSVSTHYQRMHPYIKFSFRYILDPEDQSAVFRCLECYIEYTNYNDLHQHYMDHHPEASNVLNFNQPDLVYMCRFCSYTSPNVRSLMPHYQRMHPTVKINNAMIFSSYVVEQPQKTAESQTLREILNSGPKSFSSATSTPRSSSSPALKTISKTPEPSVETDALKEAMGGNVVVYDCDVCSFASPNMHSVLVHYQKKHPEQKASYFRIQKTMRVISVDRTQSATPNSSFNTSMATPKSASSFGSDEEIYYCKHCVYSNRSVVGVLVHYQKRHPEIKVTAKYIKHGAPTPGLMKLMDELQIATPKQFMKQFNSSNNGCDGASNSSPKVGGADKLEAEMLFFCQQCDYGNRTVKGVLIHYQKKHRETKANADLVRRHTAVVRSQRERAQMVQSGNASSSVAAATPTADLGENSTNLRSLQCKHCSYTSPYVYALKKHLKKDHPTVKATAMTILHWAFQDGILEAGYHCEWCIYSHAEPQGLLLHYQRRHPEHNVDYTYMASKLWAGPDTTQQGGNLETKHYRCRDCAFEACSIWDITNHYQAVHPWAVKGDESVLLDIIKGQRSPTQQVAKGPTPFKFQIDGVLDISTSPHVSPPPQPHPRLSLATSSISNNPYQCTVCLSEYNSLHGLLTHYGKKHPGMKVKAADFAQEADINPSSVYKCRHCPYVNSRIHGVLTHYQKRHPLVKVTAEDFADDIEQLNDPADGDDKCKTQRQGYGAYRCKMCPYTHGTLEKLKVHYEKYHNQPASDMFSPTFTQFSASKHTEQVGECSVTTVLPSAPADAQQVSDFDLALSQFPVNKTEKHAIFKCQLCKYFCSTRKGIARHYRIKHNNVRAQPEGKNNVFKCALCAYTNPIRKGLAAHYQKRHDIDAYYTHCLAASKTLTEKPPKVVVPLPSDGGGGAELSEDLRLAVERKKCSLCAFQAFSRKSIVSHYIKRHPGVFPKKQHSSKLGRYFTVIYAKESEKIGVETTAAEHEDNKEVLEVQLKPEEQGAEEWLPFKCMKCFRLSFSTTELLSIHYNDHHSKDLKRDFVLQPSPSEDNLELYQCSHCELRFLALTDLAKHLTNHSEDFQKRFMRQERRRQLLSKQKALEPPETKAEKESLVNKAPIGFRCNFCVEMHPTLRAICNHLRKHVQYGEVKEGHVKQEVSEVPLGLPAESLTNGDVDEYNSPATGNLETVTQRATIGHSSVAMEARTDLGGSGGRGAALIAAARAVVSATAAASAGGAQEKERLAAGGHPCGQCDRVFMSMQGLRSHERSHSAMALFSREDKYSCQYCQFVSPFRHNLDRHVQSHHGHHKPFRCKLCPFKSAYLSRLKSHLHKAHAGEHTYKCLSCPFSSMTISQLKEHSLRDHGEALTLPKIRAATQAALRPSRLGSDAEPSLMGLHPDDPAYHEPADVRQQLSHFQLASRGQVASRGPVAAAVDGRPDGILTCEFCEFSSGYMQSLRRHYRDRHGGKKLFKCKDCSFFTCYKSSFTMHVEAGHSSPPEEGPKDLRCPFCLYHTRHKSNMIDHIVLHRDDRVAPLEVSRSKLSRHLQGLVFRCHKCTFTCSSDLALQQHLRKHAELKPYQCQLCYYDSSQRHQLEEHLRLEHKVLRNFELMGRVNLDQLEMMKERGNSTDEEEKEMVALEEEHEGVVPLRDEVMEENDFGQGADLKDEEMEEEIKAEEDENEEEKEAKIAQDLAAPICNNSNVSGGVPDKRLPCEFCGRCFTNGTEWERHVLRHGMTVNNNRSDSSNAPAIEASAPPSIGSAGIAHKDLDLSSNSVDVEEDYPNNLSERRHDESEDDKGLLETKNDQ